MSNGTGVLDGGVMSAFNAIGVRFLIARVPNPYDLDTDKKLGIYLQQVEMAESFGYLVESYLYPYFTFNTEGQVDYALSWAFPRTKKLWIDVELAYNEDVSHVRVIEGVSRALSVCRARGAPVGIYASRHTWATMTGNTSRFGDVDLWDAFWDEKPDLGGMSPYGGWTSRQVKQYDANVRVGGRIVDLNSRMM